MEPINVFDFESLAKARMDAGTWAYFASGADDEVTLRANRSAFEQIQLRPRVLVDVSTIDMKTSVLGIPVNMPILIAPMGFQRLAHSEGECATAKAIEPTGTIMVASTFSSRALEEIAQAATESWSRKRGQMSFSLEQHEFRPEREKKETFWLFLPTIERQF